VALASGRNVIAGGLLMSVSILQDLASITPEMIAAERQRRAREAWKRYYPASGPLSRQAYFKHMEFFAAGATYRQRALIAGNRTGKTLAGAYETMLHLTGLYPDWWTGRRFDPRKMGRGVRAWAAGDTSTTARDIIQHALMGPMGEWGTGMIPGDRIYDTRNRAGVPGALDTVWINHKSGKRSQIQFKSYDQGRKGFQGTEIDLFWPDEECPQDIYGEGLTRTMTTDGIVMLTFTPLSGMTPVVLDFLPGGRPPEEQGDRHVTMLGWDDAPHLDDGAKTELLAAYPAHEREARSKGIPMLGSGKIYMTPEDDFLVQPFAIPDHWLQVYGLDVGWNRTACIWAAWDRERDIVYLTSEHYAGEQVPALHVAAIKGRGTWIRGVIDPASRGRSQKDGTQLLEQYREMGLDLETADNGVESGIHVVNTRLQSGRLKVFATCQNFLVEYRLYRRDEKGHVVKQNDHLMDAARYLLMSGLDRARTKPTQREYANSGGGVGGWMG
jgi:phage terminase large subunit-like protein